MSKNPKIVIVGAGASAIAAATKLYENGLTNITILEAENRIGGRLNSVEFGGSIVDLGGQWVHGENGNVVYDMVKNLDLLSPSFNTYEDMTFYLPNGSVLDKQITDKLFRIAKEVLSNEEAGKNESGTFGNFFIKKYNEAVMMEFSMNRDILKIANQIQDWFNKFFLCLDSAKSWHDISVKGAFAYHACDGDQQLNWRKEGYKTILDVLMKKIPDPKQRIPIEEKILLNKEVNSIIWDDEKEVIVKCTDGSTYTADHVLITVSVGVLKENYKSWFQPVLPPYKINSIEHVTLGTVNKILLKFPDKWWSDDVKGFSLIWDEEAKLNLKNEIANLEPTINGKSWLENVFGFYAIDSHPKVLLGWVTGELAAEVEKLPDDVVIANCMYILRKFVGDKYHISQPDGILRSKWNSNPHFRGSYTFSSIEAEQNNASAKDLAEPISSKSRKDVLLFAGESTHDSHYSTVHGAIETGYREAERLIDLYKSFIHKEVVIVGAGMAGLGAAWTFKNLGFEDFLILEATDRPGGRIHTVYIDGKPLDLGAQWIHGKSNLLYKIASSNGLLSEEFTEEGSGIFVRNDGVIIDEFLVKKVDWEIGEILNRCRSFLNETSYPKSVGAYLDQEFENYVTHCDEKDRDIVRQLYDWHIRFQTIDNSCINLRTVSAKYWGSYVCNDDFAYYNVANGFQSLIDVILESISRKYVLFNCPVKVIDYNQSGIMIETCNGKIISCNHIILTPSLGVLREFADILPNSVMETVDSMGFYGIAKIFLIFPYCWWGDIEGFQLLWNLKDDVDDSDKWFKCVSGFEIVVSHPNVLMGFVGGENVRTVEKLTEKEIGKTCVKYLRRFLPQFEIPEPQKVISSKWLSNPWIRGSYSHISVKCDSSNCGPSDLAKPVCINNVPRILLAGEAVHPTHYSTTHGAFESGHYQSTFLYNYIKNKCDIKR